MSSKRRMRFITWCEKDPNDDSPIVYNFTDYNGEVHKFTSEDFVDYSMIKRIRQAWVTNIDNVDGTWYVWLYEDIKWKNYVITES